VIVRGSGRLRGPRSWAGGLLGGLGGGALDEREKDGDPKHTDEIDTDTSHRSTAKTTRNLRLGRPYAQLAEFQIRDYPRRSFFGFAHDHDWQV
jgi:hypothetical protein